MSVYRLFNSKNMKSGHRTIFALAIAVLLVDIASSQRRQQRTSSRRGTRDWRGTIGRETSVGSSSVGRSGGSSGAGGSGSSGNGGNVEEGRRTHERLPQFDELLADAGHIQYGGRNDLTGRSLDRDIKTSDGRNVLFELDVLEPVPCELDQVNSSSSVSVTLSSDAAVGTGSCGRLGAEGGRGGGWKRGSGRGRGVTLTGNGGNFGSRSRSKRAAAKDDKTRWLNTTIAYKLSPPSNDQFESQEMDSINAAIAEFNNYTCINFVPRSNQADYIDIIRDGGCYSSVGWVYWDQPNTLSLARGCAGAKNIPIHQLMHTLGVYHQHIRPDRDDYIRINTEYILGGIGWGKIEWGDAELADTEYSYRSVMHYGKSAFSIDRNRYDTITTLDPAFQDIIGRATTFSFEDLQLVNRIYNCDNGCSNSCPADSYRGKDCQCYCRNDADYDVPAVKCNQVAECNKVGRSCNCGSRPDACSSLDNTVCNTNSGQCVCDSNSAVTDGQCMRLTDIMCTEVGQDCQCSKKDSSACNGLSNTVCNTGTNACECISTHELNGDGVCVNVNDQTCDRIGKSCFCSQKANGCSRLSNSYCDLQTNKCECEEDYYVSNLAAGVCTRAPTCNTLGQQCVCSVQGLDACNRISGSTCDEDSESCACLPSYRQTNQGTCEASVTSYISDGTSIAPFITSPISDSTNQFRPDMGRDPTRKEKTFGITSNFRRLRASGSGKNQVGAIETSWLPAGKWCIKFSYQMKYAALWYQVSTDGVEWVYRGVGANWKMRQFFHKTVSYTSDVPIIVRFLAEVYPGKDEFWEVLMDPVIVQQC